MKIVIAPQEFKGSISALEVAKAIEYGVKTVIPESEAVLLPIADGGDGTLRTLVDASEGQVVSVRATGPLGKKLDAKWGAMGDGQTAIIEMARTCGLALLDSKELDARKTTTYGLGETISSALDAGYRHFIVGIGGSATNDGGAGMAQALGAKLLDAAGVDLRRGGAALSKLNSIDISSMDERLRKAVFEVACDVNNPLCGHEGASAVYGPQKGASPEVVEELDAALLHFSHVIRRDLDIEVNHMPGAGAAGGLGAGIVAFLNGKLRPGVDIVLEAIGFEEKLEGAHLVITGEGQMDFQTVFSKAPIGVAKLAKERGIPVVAISGSFGKNYREVHKHGIDAAFTITTAPMTLEEASVNASKLITRTAEQVMRALITGGRIPA